MLCKKLLKSAVSPSGRFTSVGKRLLFGTLGSSDTPRKHAEDRHSLNYGQVNLLMELLGCSYHQAYKIINTHRPLLDTDQTRLLKAFDMCNRFGIEKEEIFKNPDVLSILPATIEHHSMLLQESGFTFIGANELINFRPVIQKRVSLLKAYGYIPNDVDVAQNLISYLDPGIQGVPLHTPPGKDSDTDLNTVNFLVLRHYLMWRLNATQQQMDAIFVTYQRIKHKSLRLMRQTLDLLELDLGFTKQKILKHGYLIHSHPDNTMRSLDQVKMLGDMPIKEVFTKHPKTLMTTTETLLTTAKHLQEFNVSNEAIRKCPEIFTLASASVYQRLSYLKVVPEFSVLLHHPRVLRLVHYQRKAKTRLGYLREIKVKCASLHILSAAGALFDKYAREGADKTKGTDVAQYLHRILGFEEQAIRASLSRHPFWCHVPLISVQETLEFLQALGFTKKQIYTSIHILLYPKIRVESELEKLADQPCLSPRHLTPLRRGWKYHPSYATATPTNTSRTSDTSSSSDSDDDDKWLTGGSEPQKDHRLDFVIYFIEREHHFTGDGIWPQSMMTDSAVTDVFHDVAKPALSVTA